MDFLQFLFPRRCLGCGRVGQYFCAGCRATIHPLEFYKCPICNRPAISGLTHPRCRRAFAPDGLLSIFPYKGLVRKAIQTLKYRLVRDLTRELWGLLPAADLSLMVSKVIDIRTSVLVPIPIHQDKLRARGFNQAELLGRSLSEILDVPLRTDILVRTKNTPSQVSMKDRKTRLANMRLAFAVPGRVKSPAPGSVLLFDDVCTTGATIIAATQALKRAGVRRVWAITLAQ